MIISSETPKAPSSTPLRSLSCSSYAARRTCHHSSSQCSVEGDDIVYRGEETQQPKERRVDAYLGGDPCNEAARDDPATPPPRATVAQPTAAFALCGPASAVTVATAAVAQPTAAIAVAAAAYATTAEPEPSSAVALAAAAQPSATAPAVCSKCLYGGRGHGSGWQRREHKHDDSANDGYPHEGYRQ